MTKLIAIGPLPSGLDYYRAQARKHDCFYALPKIVECFIERARNELPGDFYAMPWTLNRVVTVFSGVDPVHYITYETIEDNIVRALDSLQGIVTLRGENDGR